MPSSIYHSGVAVTLDVPRVKGRPRKAYFAAPEAPGPHPGIVVIHEAYGLNENIRQVADRVTALLGRSLDRALDRYGVPHEVKVYPGARHSFFNDLGNAHDPEAAADSWRRTLAFFERYLRSAA